MTSERSEREKEIREFTFQDSRAQNFKTELLAEIDRLRGENERLSGALLKFGGKNSGHIWGLTNCSCCGELDNDYYFIGKSTICQQCFDSFPEGFNKERDKLKAENEKLKESAIYKAWALFRMKLRQILATEGIASNPGWSDYDIIRAFKEFTGHCSEHGPDCRYFEENQKLREENEKLKEGDDTWRHVFGNLSKSFDERGEENQRLRERIQNADEYITQTLPWLAELRDIGGPNKYVDHIEHFVNRALDWLDDEAAQ